MAKQIILYTGFAASMGVMSYPFAWLGDTIFDLNMRLGSLGPTLKEMATITLTTLPASMIAFALPLAHGFGLPVGKTQFVIHSTMIPIAAVLLGLFASSPIQGFIALWEKSEKKIKRDALCVYTSLATWLVYMSLFVSKAAHLNLVF